MKISLDFVGIGTSKSGTTWVHRCLREHPDICVSEPKEIPFYKTTPHTLDTSYYEAHFKHCKDERVRGEMTPEHLDYPKAADFLANNFPSAHILVFLRNPIERYLSSYYFHLKHGRQKALSLKEKYLGEKEAELKKTDVITDLTRGLYYRNLQPFLQRFSEDQVHVYLYEDILSDPIPHIQSIYKILGVDEYFVPPSVQQTKPKTVAVPRSKYFRVFLIWLRRLFTKGPLYPLLGVMRKTGVSKILTFLQRINTTERKSAEKPVDTELRHLLFEYYKADIDALSKWLKKDLTHWY